MTQFQRRFLLSLAGQIGYKGETAKIAFLNQLFPKKNIKYYENEICNTLYAKRKKNLKKQEQEKIDEVVEILKRIINTKKTVRINDDKTISASEIADFQFCPISFCIKRSFDVPSNPKMKTGTFFHDLAKMRGKGAAVDGKSILGSKRDQLPNIYKNDIVYEGHTANSEMFINDQLNIVCKPDYIMRDNETKEAYVIEEKYTTTLNRHEFYLNQKIQLTAYLETIPDVKYGYLVTWKYDYDNNISPVNGDEIDDFKLFKSNVKLVDQLSVLVNNMRTLIEDKELDISSFKYSNNKCATCSVAVYCKHKASENASLSFPYN